MVQKGDLSRGSGFHHVRQDDDGVPGDVEAREGGSHGEAEGAGVRARHPHADVGTSLRRQRELGHRLPVREGSRELQQHGPRRPERLRRFAYDSRGTGVMRARALNL